MQCRSGREVDIKNIYNLLHVCVSCPVTPTSENGLVHTQGCRFDGDDPDVSGHFVTN